MVANGERWDATVFFCEDLMLQKESAEHDRERADPAGRRRQKGRGRGHYFPNHHLRFAVVRSWGDVAAANDPEQVTPRKRPEGGGVYRLRRVSTSRYGGDSGHPGMCFSLGVRQGELLGSWSSS